MYYQFLLIMLQLFYLYALLRRYESLEYGERTV
jgi:hypothetical protein